MAKITEINVVHQKNVTAWKRGVPQSQSYALICVLATLSNGGECQVAKVINLDAARLAFKEERCKRYFKALIGLSVEEACQQVFTFGQTLHWDEVKVSELY